MRPRMYGSTDMTSLRTRTWPSASSTGALSTRAKSSCVGQPTGRLLSWTSRGLVIGSPSGTRCWFGTGWGPIGRRRAVDDDRHGDVAARRVGVGAHLVRGVDELAPELRVDALGQLDVEHDAEAEAGARRAGEAHVGGHGDV